MLSGNAVAQVQNNPVYALPHLYISGMNISIASTTVLAIAPGQCRDINNVIDMPIGYSNLQGADPYGIPNQYNIQPPIQYQNYQPPVLINSAVNGVNGLDQGTIAASSQYAIYAIGDSRGYNPVGGLLSLCSNVSPLLPSGYDSLRLLGFIETTSSSTFVYSTNKPQLVVNGLGYYVSASSVLSAGTSTTFAAIDMSSPIPTTTLPNVIALLLITYVPNAVGDYFQLRPTGSSATSGIVTIYGQQAGIAQSQYLQMIAGVGSSKPEIDYLVSSSSDSLSISVVGWFGSPHVSYPT